jgi:hypothetical protein
MIKFYFAIAVAVLFAACTNNTSSKHSKHYPSESYHYVRIDSTQLPVKKLIYVPIYSHIYINTGEYVYNLTSTLSVRNTSYSDSFYISRVIYYGSQGQMIKNYLDSALLLKPMASYEFVVEHDESKGGAGANFVVEWRARQAKTEPLIQAVSCGSSNTGISFVTDGVEIKE